MKNKFLILMAALLCLVGYQLNAQTIIVTNPAPGMPALPSTNDSVVIGAITNLGGSIRVVLNYLAPNTNALQATRWTFFGSYTKAAGLVKNTGYSFGAVYYVNSVVGTQIRMQYLDTGHGTGVNGILLPNGAITLSSAYQPFGSSIPVTLRPIAEMGAAGDLKGNLYAIVGAGTELDVYHTTNSAAVFQRASFFYGKEQWQGGNKFTTTQYGAALNFNLEKLMAKITTWLP
jgi:hypothetical protein